jgi:hypothetical protein
MGDLLQTLRTAGVGECNLATFRRNENHRDISHGILLFIPGSPLPEFA